MQLVRLKGNSFPTPKNVDVNYKNVGQNANQNVRANYKSVSENYKNVDVNCTNVSVNHKMSVKKLVMLNFSGKARKENF